MSNKPAVDTTDTTSLQQHRHQKQDHHQSKPQRRSHRKSRNGCAECKRRHIRCDEQRPACANCAIAERTCVFPVPRAKTGAHQSSWMMRTRQRRSASPSTSPPSYHHQQHAQEYISPVATAATAGTTWTSSERDTPVYTPPLRETPLMSPPPKHHHHHQQQQQQQQQPQPQLQPQVQSALPSFEEAFSTPPSTHSPFNPPLPETTPAGNLFTAEHLALLHHATSPENKFFVGPVQDHSIVDIAIRRAHDAPYLIDQVLALSALHKASLQPPQSPQARSLQHIATELQTRAVALFTTATSTIPPEDHESSIPRFLFAGILSLHDLGDTLNTIRTLHYSQFHIFVNRFVDCFRIHHGVHAILQPIYSHLKSSELKPLLSITSRIGPGINGVDKYIRGHECEPLYALLQSSDLGPATVAACKKAAESLQWAFDMSRSLPSAAAVPHAASAFSVKVGTDYIEVLRRLQPEALIILAYYGVLLHYSRDFWIFDTAGVSMVRAIAQHLGTYWKSAMAWPLRAVGDES
ncbi:hypothetical protein QQS21_008891 [Conoideocrella luteorostrata]|uniref:Zn(2)-C6 fungal-type domain-containing protein n=1 Tax=Conoideocrella luteorostrata TaxID=1105319 RepID=A0AAJ0CKC2_9HYPO|nr:hypothetical protein QQS21_008891 [Conoideocrella luteorostrata]